MALKRTLAQRLFNISKVSRQALTGGCRAAPAAQSGIVSRSQPAIDDDPGDNGVFRRYLHKRAVTTPELRSAVPLGDGLRERIKALDVARGRIRLDGLTPPPAPVGEEPPELTAEDARKLLRVAQLEAVRARLREIREIWITYPEFVRVCGEVCSDPGQGIGLAKLLDESGNVVVFENMVLLRPDMVTKAIAGLIPLPERGRNDPRRKELKELEKVKSEIEREAESQVRKELWAGLGFLVVQTAAFMRLTFWELTWDVMEPICFYVTSFYFIVGYAFFLKTSREPSFEGFFHSRLLAKQKRLMRAQNFNLKRYEELRSAFHPQAMKIPSAASSPEDGITLGFGLSGDPVETRN
ncbi:calcium uniporter protein 3, mitochondrial-like [Punica granatum]|uniref:Calcium uniporter protein 3, mitochondrial-like n=1 Tax=Punica granatum TaxID=22663 RepID=A0A218XI41_PUNGR|nr:calcium uniporter protein 3, mitochondrial-like [Punica granatum]OWM84607.1 hypothetical protein CDL15_Pgr014178 [Punica granatum]